VPAPGAQSLLPLVAALAPPGRAAVLGPTYPEHARAAALAGHRIEAVRDLACLRAAALAVVVNPNNPDGRIVSREALLDCAHTLQASGGMLIVDEAFMEVGPRGASLAGDVREGTIVVLRSVGKFFGLAGIRLGFALAAPQLAGRLRARLGPWAVSGPALAIGAAALGDPAWAEMARAQLAAAAARLDHLLLAAGLEVIGGTLLFRLARTPLAGRLFDELGRAGILVRRFAGEPTWLRFGLPAGEPDWERLSIVLEAFAVSRDELD
jgi:cobalamin biosynthesis protein CobC